MYDILQIHRSCLAVAGNGQYCGMNPCLRLAYRLHTEQQSMYVAAKVWYNHEAKKRGTKGINGENGRLAWLGRVGEGCIVFFFGSFIVAKLSSGIPGSAMRRIYCRIALRIYTEI